MWSSFPVSVMVRTFRPAARETRGAAAPPHFGAAEDGWQEGAAVIARAARRSAQRYESRQAVIDAAERSRYLSLVPPRGSMYAFLGVNTKLIPQFDDEAFALELLEQQHVLIAPGSSFNTEYRDHFRITTLPLNDQLTEVFARMETVLDQLAARDNRLEIA